jgi:hypothetical protein
VLEGYKNSGEEIECYVRCSERNLSMIRNLILFLTLFLSFPIVSFAEQNNWSFSIGKFDANDDDENVNNDSFQIRFEYLSGKKLFDDLKPFTGLMINGDDGKYLYSGVRKDISLSSKWIFTPSFAVGYYDRGSSKDLGHNLEFRSQIELSREIENQNRLGFSINHISNARIGDTNPGVESVAISIIRPF